VQVILSIILIVLVLMHSGRDTGFGGLGFTPASQGGQHIVERNLTRLTVVGSAYLTAISLLPEFLISRLAVPFYFGGTSLLIVVTVTMDTVGQVHAHLLAHQYEGLIKKSRLRGRRG